MQRDLINSAIKLFLESNNPSLSLLRVRFNLSESEALQIMDYLVSIGFISDYRNGFSRILNSSFSLNSNPAIINSPFSIDDVDKLEGHDFEYFCSDLLKFNGFSNIKVTVGSGDFGIDILCSKDDISYAIQCKCYSHSVGNRAVQEAVSGCIYYKCNKSVVMTNSVFTPAAIETARLTNTILWDRTQIKILLAHALSKGYKPNYK